MSDPSARTVMDDTLACIGFFTRLRVPAPRESRSFSAAIWAAPLAGLVVAVVQWIAMLAAGWTGFSASIVAAIALAASVLVSGALHEDGAADVADGFGGGRTREAKLEIMRDSRIGAYGVIALVLSLLVRWSALTALAHVGTWHTLFVLVSAHAASRALLPAFAAWLPPARADGLSSGLGAIGRDVALAALALGAVSLLFSGLAFALASAAALAVLFALFGLLCRRQIGGQTGDTLGALQQMSECTLLALSTTLVA